MKSFCAFYSKVAGFTVAFGLVFSSILSAQTDVLWQESFETQGNMGARYTVSNEFNDSGNDHFQRTDGSDIGNVTAAYSGHDGSFFFATEDTDDTGTNGGDGFDYKSIAFNQINATGWTDLTFFGMFAIGNTGENDYDYADGVVVSYSTDGGSNYTQALKFRYNNISDAGFNDGFVLLQTINPSCLLQSPNGGFGIYGSNVPCDAEVLFPFSNMGGAISPAFTTFSFSIPNSATIDILIEVSLESGDEEFAFDNFRILGTMPGAPVELTKFTGEKRTESVLLEWETANEINNEYFQLERSTDGRQFATIAKIDGAINSFQNIRYDYMDTNLPEAREIYYRLKQTDLDGTATMSEVVVVENKINEENFTIFPNPVGSNDRLNVISKLEGKFEVEIVDFNGRVIYTEAKNLDAGTWDLPIGDLSSGSYLLRLRSSDEVYIDHFVKM